MKKVLVTGSDGFIGRNLIASLALRDDIQVLGFDTSDDLSELRSHLSEADFVFHLAGVNRPLNPDEFISGNTGLTQTIVDLLINDNKRTPILFASSIQAEQNNPYGISKRAAEDAVFAYSRRTQSPIFIYRLPNLFGKWCRPNYNSVVATFCSNIAQGRPVQINDPDTLINLVYIDDVVISFIATLDGITQLEGDYVNVQPLYALRLGQIADLIHSFKRSRQEKTVPNMSDPFIKKLYATYLSYLPTDQFSYPLKMNVDERGSFTEILRTADRGQVSINILKPGITKGNHWHHTKNEKFLVVSGQGVIRFRRIGSDEIHEYPVSAEKMEVVDIPTGYTHNITNTGTGDMATIMWCNEPFDPDQPDTFFEPV